MTKKKFLAKINDRFEARLTQDQALPFEFIENNQIHAIDQTLSVNAGICAEDFLNKKYTLKINGSFYEINFLDELDLLIEELGLAAGQGAVHNELISPMPGLIVEILVTPGSKVKAGDALVVLEAMKMENTLSAPADGIIKSINVGPSQAVDKGTVLIEFENYEVNQ